MAYACAKVIPATLRLTRRAKHWHRGIIGVDDIKIATNSKAAIRFPWITSAPRG